MEGHRAGAPSPLPRESGDERLLLCHIEIQGKQERDFAERLYQYAVRIYMRHGSHPASLVILTDENPRFRPLHYSIKRPGVFIEVRYDVGRVGVLTERREGIY